MSPSALSSPLRYSFLNWLPPAVTAMLTELLIFLSYFTMFPDESNTIRFGYTPGPMATDEALNGLTGGGSSNVYYGMDFATGRITSDFYGDSNPNLNQWAKYYKIIRKCNSVLQNLDRPKGMVVVP